MHVYMYNICMPTILTIKGVRFYFYSNEEDRIHVHIQVQNAKAKIWMDDFTVAKSDDFKRHELNALVKLARKYEQEIKQAWEDHFGRD